MEVPFSWRQISHLIMSLAHSQLPYAPCIFPHPSCSPPAYRAFIVAYKDDINKPNSSVRHMYGPGPNCMVQGPIRMVQGSNSMVQGAISSPLLPSQEIIAAATVIKQDLTPHPPSKPICTLEKYFLIYVKKSVLFLEQWGRIPGDHCKT
jgi:hypothetical protein